MFGSLGFVTLSLQFPPCHASDIPAPLYSMDFCASSLFSSSEELLIFTASLDLGVFFELPFESILKLLY